MTSYQIYSDCAQKVPTFALFDNQMVDSDLMLPNFMLDSEECLWETQDIKEEQDFDSLCSTHEFQYSVQARPSTFGSPFMSTPMMGHQQNFVSSKNFSPYPSAMANSVLVSPSSPYAASPASTSYSSSSTESPIHPNPHPAEEFLSYGLRQSLHRPAFASQGHPPGGNYVQYPGRRRRRDELLSPEEYERRRLRRERNKQAAWRCRTRRRERIEALEQETAEIEGQNSLVESEISNLKDELAELKKSLQNHECCRRETSDIAPPKVIDVKVKQESS